MQWWCELGIGMKHDYMLRFRESTFITMKWKAKQKETKDRCVYKWGNLYETLLCE